MEDDDFKSHLFLRPIVCVLGHDSALEALVDMGFMPERMNKCIVILRCLFGCFLELATLTTIQGVYGWCCFEAVAFGLHVPSLKLVAEIFGVPMEYLVRRTCSVLPLLFIMCSFLRYSHPPG